MAEEMSGSPVMNLTSNRTPVLAGKQMSATLRERLKRSGRSYKTPCKKQRLVDAAPEDNSIPLLQHSPEAGCSSLQTSDAKPDCEIGDDACSGITTSEDMLLEQPCPAGHVKDTEATEMLSEHHAMKHRIAEKQEKLRKLKLVKIHRSKNDIGNLESLTSKWKQVSQRALQELWESTDNEPRPTLTQLVDHFQLDHTLIGYNSDEENFT